MPTILHKKLWQFEHCFEHLDAPIKRVAGLETPIPFAADLEREYLANDRFETALKELIAY